MAASVSPFIRFRNKQLDHKEETVMNDNPHVPVNQNGPQEEDDYEFLPILAEQDEPLQAVDDQAPSPPAAQEPPRRGAPPAAYEPPRGTPTQAAYQQPRGGQAQGADEPTLPP